jgi:uncharacterized protein CbrC (UPF0167 family)
MNLPVFKYHPDPVATGSIIVSGVQCRCCGESRGYVYTSNVYCTEELDGEICPWCIADGSAAKKFKATFVADMPLRQYGMDEEIILEVTTRTPGYETWQQEVWLTHCQDACAFLGEASREEILAIANEGLQVTGGEWIDGEMMKSIAKNYRPKGSPAFYKFRCLHCNQILYGMDFD